MTFTQDIDALVDAGKLVVDTQFDKETYYAWKRKAHIFLTNFVGADHPSSLRFAASLKKRDDEVDTAA